MNLKLYVCLCVICVEIWQANNGCAWITDYKQICSSAYYVLPFNTEWVTETFVSMPTSQGKRFI